MEPRKKLTWKDLRIGLLALGSFIIVFVTIIIMGEGQFKLFKEQIRYRTFLPEANGLRSGSEVWVAGVEVGQVRAVRFADPNDPTAVDQIEVILEVDESVRSRIRNNSVATLRTIGLLGDKYVEVKPGTNDALILPANGIIEGISLSTFDELVGVGRTTARGFNELMLELRELAEDINNEKGSMGKMIHNDELYANINETVDETTRLIQRAENGPGTMGRLMSDPTLYNNLVSSSVATNRTITALDSTLASANSLLRILQQPEGTLGKLSSDPAIYEQMESTITRIDSLIQKVERGEGSLGRMTQNETIALEMEGLLIDMRALIHDFRENPKKYFRVSVF